MTENQTLLADYAGTGSEAAFRELVARYLDFVYSAAARLVDGAPHLAEDVTQIVFTDLARQARSLGREPLLGGWLHRHTCFVAANLMRGERRRQSRERRAAEMNAMPDHSAANLAQIAPILDDAINHLNAEDRTAILLRFFEQRDLRSIGQALGGNEDAARKRVARAVDKLHVLLKRRGVTFSAAALGAALAAGTVKAAPIGLSASVAGAAMAGAATGGGTALTLLKIMAMTKLQTAAVGAIVAAGIVATLVVQQKAQATLHQEEDTLARQAAQLAQLRADNQRLAQPAAPRPGTLNTPAELDRLRAEVSGLRPQTNDLTALRAQVRQHQATLAQGNTMQSLRTQAEAAVKMNYSKQMVLAFFMYANEHGDHFPTNFDQAISYIPPEAAELRDVTTNQFEMTVQSPDMPKTNASKTIVLREKQAWQSNGKWSRVYGFADGHIEVASSPDGNFDQWESQRIVPSATPNQ